MSINVIFNVLDKLIEINRIIADKPILHTTYELQMNALISKLNEYLPTVPDGGMTEELEIKLNLYKSTTDEVIDKLKKMQIFKMQQLEILKERAKRPPLPE